MKASIHIALLRGINVGGKNTLAMTDLVAIFSELGCRRVKTYIQSGNVLFEAPSAAAITMPSAVTEAISKQFGLEVPVVLRSGREFERVVANNPMISRGGDPEDQFVAFLSTWPEPAQVQALDPDRSPGDSFQVIGREVFVQLPNGAARTKISTAWLDQQLATTSTMRNWNTCRRIADLADSI